MGRQDPPGRLDPPDVQPFPNFIEPRGPLVRVLGALATIEDQEPSTDQVVRVLRQAIERLEQEG